jgi:hypothetical protein
MIPKRIRPQNNVQPELVRNIRHSRQAENDKGRAACVIDGPAEKLENVGGRVRNEHVHL